MKIYQQELKDIWLKAAVLGSIWGSIEIIVGSFFHNVRLPMSGTILALMGISLLIAFGQIWKDKSLFVRAGLICALMKSISPSAVLFGPMTGIFLEALLLELGVFLLGRNLIGYIIGGILALYSVILHKLISLLILYGFDLIRISKNLYFFISKQLKIDNLNFYEAFIIISLMYVIAGIIAAVIGYYIGNRSKILQGKNTSRTNFNLNFTKKYFEDTENQQSLTILLIHSISMVGLLALMNFLSFSIAVVFITIYVFACLYYYKRAIRYLKKPMIWLQIIILVLVSAVFYNSSTKLNIYDAEGLKAGLQMGLRAILIMTGFAAISTEMRNPIIKALLFRKGYWQLYTSLSLAFSALPYLLKNTANPKNILKHPVDTLTNNLLTADLLMEEFKKSRKYSSTIILSGEKHQGKTTFVSNLVDLLNKDKIRAGGFVAPGKFENGKRSEFKLKNIINKQEELLCSIHGHAGQQKAGPFYFFEKGLQFGKDILADKNLCRNDFIVIDELGPFELKGKGWSVSIEHLIEHCMAKQIWVIRKSLVQEMIRRFGVNKAIVFDISEDDLETVYQKIVDL